MAIRPVANPQVVVGVKMVRHCHPLPAVFALYEFECGGGHGGSGAVLDREGDLAAFAGTAIAAQVEIGVAPGVELGRAAQGLAGANVAGTRFGSVPRVAGNDVVDFRDLAVLDAETDIAAFRPGPMNNADTDVVVAVDAHHSDLLIAHRRRRSFLRGRENFSVADVRRRTPRRMLGRRRSLSLCLARGGESEQPERSS
jgi:hypothetical protein